MASRKKIDYPNLKTYIVDFPSKDKASMLMLGYNVSDHFQFVDLETGRIMNLVFETIDEAEKWLAKASKIIERNVDVINTTYVP